MFSLGPSFPELRVLELPPNPQPDPPWAPLRPAFFSSFVCLIFSCPSWPTRIKTWLANSFLYSYLFIYLAVSGLSCSVRDLRCITWDLSPQCMDSSCDAWPQYLPRGLSGSTLCEILVPWPGIDSVSIALEGRFLTTRSPEKFHSSLVKKLLTWSVNLCWPARLPCFCGPSNSLKREL